MSPRIQVLREILAGLNRAAERLAATHRGVAGFFPLSPGALSRQSASDQERLDAYAIRYARCQDLLFPAMRAQGGCRIGDESTANVGERPKYPRIFVA